MRQGTMTTVQPLAGKHARVSWPRLLPPTKCHSTHRVLRATWLWRLSMVGLRASLESRGLSQHTFPHPSIQ